MSTRSDRDNLAFRRIKPNEWARITTQTPESLAYTGLSIVTTTVGATATKIVLPDGANYVTIFHQNKTANVHFNGTSSVDTSSPIFDAYATIDLAVNSDFELYMISDIDVDVFAMATVKEL